MPIVARMLDRMRARMRLEIYSDAHGVHVWAYEQREDFDPEDPHDIENPEFDVVGDDATEAVTGAYKRFCEWRECKKNKV